VVVDQAGCVVGTVTTADVVARIEAKASASRAAAAVHR
jgi:CBS-domain-containing membrane protein